MACLLALAASGPSAQADAVGPDRRIELFSILFHLAGAPEYSMNRFPTYSEAVDAYFADACNHAAVATTREVRQKYKTGFFHPMNLAVHLTAPPELAERTRFDQPGHALGTRWPAEQTRPYLDQIRAFYKDARVEGFFKQQAAVQDLVVTQLRVLLEQEGDAKWFDRFFGLPATVKFFVVPAPLNGGAQYGATYRDSGGAEEAYAIIGIHKLDDMGLPRFDTADSDNVVHEFAHTLTNRAVSAILPDLALAGPALFERVRQQMREQSYGEWQTMVYEAVVRAVVIRFMAAHRGADAAKREVEEQEKLGFRETGALAAVLAEYEQSRDRYPVFASMPRLVAVLQEAATR